MDLEAGTLYEVNKQLSMQEELLSRSKILERQEEIRRWYRDHVDKYAMLLCHEQRDFTVFRLEHGSYSDMAEVIIECLLNRGKIVSIDPADGNAWEIWLRIDDEDYCYYLFRYDEAIVEI